MEHNTEIAVLNILWTLAHPMTVDAIGQAASLEVGEVTTALAAMASRGLVTLEDGNYRPLLSTTEYCTREVRELLNTLYGGDAVAFLKDYIDTAAPEDRVALENAIIKGGQQS